MSEPLRIGDAERDAVVADLQAHYTDGRLELGEFEDRVTSARMARTASELEVVVRDLPDLVTTSSPRRQPASAGAVGFFGSLDRSARNALVRLAVFAVFFTGIWAFSSGLDSHFWPIYPILGIGLGTVFSILHDDDGDDDSRSDD